MRLKSARCLRMAAAYPQNELRGDSMRCRGHVHLPESGRIFPPM